MIGLWEKLSQNFIVIVSFSRNLNIEVELFYELFETAIRKTLLKLQMHVIYV